MIGNTLNFLSIDWDYFIQVSSLERMMLPDGGNENLSSMLQKFVWASYYARTPKEYGNVNITYDKVAMAALRAFLTKRIDPVQTRLCIARSHIEAYEFFSSFTLPYPEDLLPEDARTEKSQVRLWNVDDHSDVYGTYGDSSEKLHCGNWLSKLMYELRPEQSYNLKSYWVCKDEEYESNLIAEEGYETKLIKMTMNEFLKLPKQEKFDAVFLCRSDPWSPPHLDTGYQVLAEYLKSKVIKRNVFISKDGQESLKNRYDSQFKKMVKGMEPVVSKFRNFNLGYKP